MDAWKRAITFIRTIDERASEEVAPFARGRALINRRLRLVHDANYLLADRLQGATADELIQEAERIQGAIGLTHRRVNVDDQAAAGALAQDFAARGYIPEEFVVMVRSGSSDRPLETDGVRPVSWEQLREARRRRRLLEPWAFPALVDQILARYELTAGLVPTTYFGIIADGLVVSSCELRREGRLAQVETVETMHEYRGRGYARAVVSAAIQAANAQDFVFLVADKDDWPQHFYRRLGFETVGIESRFLRLLDA